MVASRTLAGMAFERVTVNPERMGGKPCIRDLRVTVTMVLGQLAGGRTADEILADYPYLERKDLFAALEYAAAVVDQRGCRWPAQRETARRREPFTRRRRATPRRRP